MSHKTEIHPKDAEKIRNIILQEAKALGGLSNLGKQLNVSVHNLSAVTNGHRSPWPKLLAELGYKPIIRYVRITK